MITAKNKDAFWGAVEDCLVVFHQIDREIARRQTDELRQDIASLPRRTTEDIIYHDEPFYIAARLANQPLDLDEHWESYKHILDCRGW